MDVACCVLVTSNVQKLSTTFLQFVLFFPGGRGIHEMIRNLSYLKFVWPWMALGMYIYTHECYL